MIQPLSSIRPLTIAHRAGNDPARARLAIEAGVDVLEADVWRHRGRLEVRHTKTMGRIPLLWDRWSLERGWGARLELEALLELLPPSSAIMLDLKGNAPELSGEVMRALRRSARTG